MSTYFQMVKDQQIFKEEKLICYIPKIYENKGLFIRQDNVSTLGIFEMEIWTKAPKPIYKQLFIPAMITTMPMEVSSTVHRGQDCYVLEYVKNQPFMLNCDVIKQESLAGKLFSTFIELGNFPRAVRYNDLAFFFDYLQEVTGIKISIDHSIKEVIMSHLSREVSDTSIKKRHGNLKKPDEFEFIGLRAVSESPDSTTAKLYGSYYADGLNSALTTENKDRSDLEDLIRE